MQIIVATQSIEARYPADVNNIATTEWKIAYSPVINEVMETVPDGVTAVVEGDDIKVGNKIIFNQDGSYKIVEVSSIPSNFKPNQFTYDGTTWAANPNYDLINQAIPEQPPPWLPPSSKYNPVDVRINPNI